MLLCKKPLTKNSGIKQNKEKGVTLIEILVVLVIIMILVSTSVLIINPVEKKREARDNKRFSDLNVLDRSINEYMLDNSVYPDLEDTLRVSTALPDGNTSVDNAASGWIDADLSPYTSRLPIDPINDSTYFYAYYHTTFGYEISTTLEYYFEESQNDGGNDPNSYEMGNVLTLISP